MQFIAKAIADFKLHLGNSIEKTFDANLNHPDSGISILKKPNKNSQNNPQE